MLQGSEGGAVKVTVRTQVEAVFGNLQEEPVIGREIAVSASSDGE